MDKKEVREEVLREIWLIRKKLEVLEEIIRDLLQGEDDD